MLRDRLAMVARRCPAFRLEGEPLTPDDLVAHFVRHGEVHLEQIGRLRAANGW